MLKDFRILWKKKADEKLQAHSLVSSGHAPLGAMFGEAGRLVELKCFGGTIYWDPFNMKTKPTDIPEAVKEAVQLWKTFRPALEFWEFMPGPLGGLIWPEEFMVLTYLIRE